MTHEIAHFSKTNRQTEELLQAIRERRLVVLTGAGFSRFASGDPTIDGHKVASWEGLLRHGYEYCVRNNLHRAESTRVIELQLQEKGTPHLIGAAQTILSWLDRGPGNHRHKWLDCSIGKLNLIRPELVEALRTISPVLVTLNYEDLLEQGTHYPAVNWRQYDLIARVIRREVEPHIIHLHGFWKDPESLVADHYSYRDLCKNIPAQNFMTDLFVYHRMLFVGCRGTFEDPNFTGVIKYISENYRDCSHRHYVLCRDAEISDFNSLLEPTNILEPLEYGNSYEDLLGFLQRLGRDAGVMIEEEARTLPLMDSRRYDSSLRFKRPAEIWKMQFKG